MIELLKPDCLIISNVATHVLIAFTVTVTSGEVPTHSGAKLFDHPTNFEPVAGIAVS